MLFELALLWPVVSLMSMARAPHTPDVNAQRAAMNKLQFLSGAWSGQARIWRSADDSIDLLQTEQVSYKLDGLILVIEGVGKRRTDGRVVLQALGLISYDDEAGVYRMRAFNDGRWLESDVRLDKSNKGLQWGFAIGEMKTASTLAIGKHGEWTEEHQLTIGSEPSRKFMEVTVERHE